MQSQLKQFKLKCDKKDNQIEEQTNEISKLKKKLQQQTDFHSEEENKSIAKIKKLEEKLKMSDDIVKRQTSNIGKLVEAA